MGADFAQRRGAANPGQQGCPARRRGDRGRGRRRGLRRPRAAPGRPGEQVRAGAGRGFTFVSTRTDLRRCCGAAAAQRPSQRLKSPVAGASRLGGRGEPPVDSATRQAASDSDESAPDTLPAGPGRTGGAAFQLPAGAGGACRRVAGHFRGGAGAGRIQQCSPAPGPVQDWVKPAAYRAPRTAARVVGFDGVLGRTGRFNPAGTTWPVRPFPVARRWVVPAPPPLATPRAELLQACGNGWGEGFLIRVHHRQRGGRGRPRAHSDRPPSAGLGGQGRDGGSAGRARRREGASGEKAAPRAGDGPDPAGRVPILSPVAETGARGPKMEPGPETDNRRVRPGRAARSRPARKRRRRGQEG